MQLITFVHDAFNQFFAHQFVSDHANSMDFVCLISTNLNVCKGGNAFVGPSPSISTSNFLIVVFYRTWCMVHNTNGQDRNNDVITLHSAPSFITAVDIEYHERQSSPMLV